MYLTASFNMKSAQTQQHYTIICFCFVLFCFVLFRFCLFYWLGDIERKRRTIFELRFVLFCFCLFYWLEDIERKRRTIFELRFVLFCFCLFYWLGAIERKHRTIFELRKNGLNWILKILDSNKNLVLSRNIHNFQDDRVFWRLSLQGQDLIFTGPNMPIKYINRTLPSLL